MENYSLFNNTETAFKLKSDADLERAYFLFKMIANEPLVRIGTAVTNFAINLHLPVQGLIRATVFDHFCGGVDEEDCLPVIEKMYSKGKVSSVLDYSVEGKESEEQFNSTVNKILKILDFVDQKEAIPFGVFKPSGLGRFFIWQKVSEGQELNATEQEEWMQIEQRFDVLCKKAHDCDVPLLIDAEESWMQDAADDLVTKMMRKYNTEKAIVYNTLQLYRHDRLDYLKNLHLEAKQKGFKIGMKIVRGAYMEKENKRAQEKGYVSPICVSKEATDINFNKTLDYILENLQEIAVFIGTHNEYSCYKAMDLMNSKGIDKKDSRVWLGQLFGMSDHISYNLASQGYNIAKYLPFGPVREVMPYLIRRAEENTSVAGQTTRELDLLSKEKKRRKL